MENRPLPLQPAESVSHNEPNGVRAARTPFRLSFFIVHSPASARTVHDVPAKRFTITKVTPKGADAYDVTGNMTIKGITNAVTFPVTVKQSGSAVEATGKVTLDRTKYDRTGGPDQVRLQVFL